MANEPNQGGQEGGGENQNQPGDKGVEAKGGEAAPPKKPAEFVTPEILQGVLQRHSRSTEENSKKFAETISKQFEAVNARLEELSKAAPPPKEGGAKGAHGDNAAAILTLEKELKEAKARIEAESKARLDAESREQSYKFRTKVEAALARNKCTNTAAAFAVLQEGKYLSYDPETEKITAKVKDTQYGYGDVEVDLDTFLKNTFSEEMLPQLFEGKVKPGAPASGDNGSSFGAKSTFRESDLKRMSSEDWRKHRDQIDEAMRTGKLVTDM